MQIVFCNNLHLQPHFLGGFKGVRCYPLKNLTPNTHQNPPDKNLCLTLDTLLDTPNTLRVFKKNSKWPKESFNAFFGPEFSFLKNIHQKTSKSEQFRILQKLTFLYIKCTGFFCQSFKLRTYPFYIILIHLQLSMFKTVF